MSAFKNVGILWYTTVVRMSVCPFNFVFLTPPKPLGEFDENWYKERSHCVDVHIFGELCPVTVKRVMDHALNFFFENILCFCNSS
jgi:hypothetical protein